jgi:hypothetical protein
MHRKAKILVLFLFLGSVAVAATESKPFVVSEPIDFVVKGKIVQLAPGSFELKTDYDGVRMKLKLKSSKGKKVEAKFNGAPLEIGKNSNGDSHKIWPSSSSGQEYDLVIGDVRQSLPDTELVEGVFDCTYTKDFNCHRVADSNSGPCTFQPTPDGGSEMSCPPETIGNTHEECDQASYSGKQYLKYYETERISGTSYIRLQKPGIQSVVGERTDDFKSSRKVYLQRDECK